MADVFGPRAVPDELLTRAELAAAMKCSVDTIDRMKADGMPYVPWGRRGVRYRFRETLAWAREQREHREAA
jgi:phage terminase Nu1 subunit (DNA packaging protein)